jgi:CRP/FNR family transcriptional regulator
LIDDKKNVFDNLSNAFPFLRDSDEGLQKEVATKASSVHISKGTFIFFEGDECTSLALIISGTARVYKSAESGREITLYRINRGESCVLTASCIFGRNRFPAVAVAEEDIEAVVVPSGVFRHWMNEYEVWRDFVFNLLSKRLSEVMTTIEEVAFRRMDIRIAEFLVNKYRQQTEGLKITHQDIASELGTSREVVSRILKHFEYDSLISLSRGTITVLDKEGLLKKSGHEK